MQINCPICSTAIDITEAHVGQKGRCVTCNSKFIIPEQLNGEFQILERGEAHREEKKGSEPPRVKPPVDKPEPIRKPALNVPVAGARSARSYAMRPQKKSGVMGFWIIMLCIGGAGAFAYFQFFASEDGTDPKVAANTDPPPSESPTPNPPNPEPTPPAPNGGEDAEGEDTITFDPPPPPPEGQDPADAPAPSLEKEKRHRALAFLKSEQPNKRTGAFTALRKLGDPYKEIYTALLDEAREHHLTVLADKAFDISTSENALSGFQSAYDDWKDTAAGALKMAQTNWKSVDENNYKAKHAEMDRAFDESERLYANVGRAAKKVGGKELDSLEKYVAVLAEFETEIAWCAGREPEAANDIRKLITEAGGADDFVESLGLATTVSAAVNSRTAVADHNRGCGWAGSTYRSFATLLNDRRVALGLGALRLDELLSKSCGEHSSDMLFLGYFSHTGNDGSSFGKRAKRAGFTGAPSGECIFKGSTSAAAAHKAWWYSDGHRLIMYASGPNTLGLGTAENIWTLNTGKRSW